MWSCGSSVVLLTRYNGELREAILGEVASQQIADLEGQMASLLLWQSAETQKVSSWYEHQLNIS